MKTKTLYILCCLIALWSISCNKDLGNYDYQTLDSLRIEKITDKVELAVGENLKLNPQLIADFSRIDSSDFVYEWVLYDKTAANTNDQRMVFSTRKNIDIAIAKPSGSYSSFFTVRQSSTGRIWTKPFQLEIKGSFGNYGWFVLQEKNNKAHLDFYEDDPTNWNSYPKVYRDFNNLLIDTNTNLALQLMGAPLSLANTNTRDLIYRQSKDYLYINTDQHTYKINISDGYQYNPALYSFTNETISGNPKSVELYLPFRSAGSMVIKDQDLYSFAFAQSIYFNIPLNRDPNGRSFKIAPQVAAPMNNVQMNTLTYDINNKRFVRFSRSSLTAITINTSGQAFDAHDLRKDLVWMGHTASFNGQAVAILKDGTEFHLARMGFNSSGQFSANSMESINGKLTDIDKASHFAIDNQYGYLFYATDTKVYQYDMDAKVLKVVRDLGNRQVSLLKFERLTNLAPGSLAFSKQLERMEPVNYSLILATYNPASPNASGKVELLRIQPLMADLTPAFTPFDGLGKVKDINYIDKL